MLTTNLPRRDSRFSLLLVVLIALAFSGCESQTKNAASAQSAVDSPQSPAKSSDGVESTQLDTNDDTAQPEDSSKQSTEADETDESATFVDNPVDQAAAPEEHTIDIPESWNRLGKREIWIDFKQKEVIVGGIICLNFGPLEMFACPHNTKEHESIISVNALSSEVHAALIALGAEPGEPCQWDPEYKPATGPVIDVRVTWFDEEKKQPVTIPARSMIRDSRTRKPMTHQWVFGGSQIWEDPDTGDKIYYGDAGEMVCLSNFSTATMDLNVESSQSNDGLLFEAFTENIPPLGTKVYMKMKPGERIEAESPSNSQKQIPESSPPQETDDQQEADKDVDGK